MKLINDVFFNVGGGSLNGWGYAGRLPDSLVGCTGGEDDTYHGGDEGGRIGKVQTELGDIGYKTG